MSVPRFTGRSAVITLGVIVAAILIFGRFIAQFLVDIAWHQALGRSDVLWGQILTRIGLFGGFFLFFVVVATINLFIADRAAPDEFPANVHPYVEQFHQVFGSRLRLVRYGGALVLAFLLALPMSSYWQSWLLFRHAQPFGSTDPQFGLDVGFYVFTLPFMSLVVDWLFVALIAVIVLTVFAHLVNGGVVFTSSWPAVRSATKAHLAVLLSILAAVKAADYWLSRYELTFGTRGFVQGATYTVVKAQIPALILLVMIGLLTAILFLVTIRTGQWRVPLVSSVLWLVMMIVGGMVYPSVVESLVVRPNQEEREAPYIARNVEATRAAMGIDEVTTKEVTFADLSADQLEADTKPFERVRLLNPSLMLSRFRIDRGEVAGLKIADLDVDRYDLGDGTEQVLVAARELDLGTVANTTWQGTHLANTRGCELVVAPVGEVTVNDRPRYRVPEVDRPELYFSPDIGGYSVVGTDVAENPCGENEPYAGTAGVPMGGLFRRAVMALAFLDYNLVGSGAINADSQLLWIKSAQDRVEKIAPFFSYDGDPYPVVVDGGVQWVIDGYTITSRYPYAQRIGGVQLSRSTGLTGDANYIRNSVKATVDAYTGEVRFYVIDPDDPIVTAWGKAFPDLLVPVAEMPAELKQHLRYPEDLFRVQTALYSKYQIAPDKFFQRTGAWSIAQAPSVDRQDAGTVGAGASPEVANTRQAFATESNVSRFHPYYTLFGGSQAVADHDERFVMLRPFVPFSTDDQRTELQAYMTASSEPDSYGELTSYVVADDPLPAGPLRVADQAESELQISSALTLLANQETGTKVKFGDMQLIPVADGLVYVRPVYVVSSDVTEYRNVIVSYNNRSVMAPRLDEALARLFSGYEASSPAVTADDGDEGTVESGDTGAPADITSVLAQADRVFAEAQDALAAGDLGAYQDAMNRVGALIDQANDLIGQPAPSDS